MNEQEIASKQQQLAGRLGALTAQYEYQKKAIVAEFEALDVALTATREAEAKKAPEALRNDIDQLRVQLERWVKETSK